MNGVALIVDDEPDIRELIAMTLTRIGLDCHTAANLDEAHHLLSTYAFDVCLTDMKLPDGNGVDFVRRLHDEFPRLPVAVITAHGNQQAAVDAMKNGAFDFVSKPVDIRLLRRLVMQAMEVAAANDPTLHPGDTPTPSGHASLAALSGRTTDEADAVGASRRADNPMLTGGHRLIGTSPPMQALQRLIAKVARTNAPVWITGESGTGKELIARLIHDNSPRQNGPFVAINCGAIPSELMESELFGHKKGSFTGAVGDREGLFAQAQGGTLFFDEVAELPLHMQVKLLRAIQERTIRMVGSTDELAVDARVLSASHKDLAAEVDAGHFRHDLYYRLNVISLEAPALRERPEDIPILAGHLLARHQPLDAAQDRLCIDEDAMQALVSYHFPGNVRELENLLERAVTLADGPTIGFGDLQFESRTSRPVTAAGGDRPIDDHGSLSSALTHRLAPAAATRSTTAGQDRADAETQRLLHTLEQTRWNRKLAARQLGLTYRQLRYRLMKLGIDR